MNRVASKLVTRTRRYEAARAAWEDAIIDAHNEGLSLRAIADVAGISHVGIAKLLRRRGVIG